MSKNSLVIGIFARYSKYPKYDQRARVAEIFLWGTYGITKRLDVSMLFPYGYISSEITGIENIALSLKYRLINRNKFSMSINPTFYLPMGKREHRLVSETFGFLINVNFGTKIGVFDVPLSVGFGSVDYFRLKSRLFVNTAIITLSGGIIYHINPEFSFFLEGMANMIPEFSDEGINLQLGGIWRISNAVLLKGSAGFGLFNDLAAVPDFQSTAGLTYFFN